MISIGAATDYLVAQAATTVDGVLVGGQPVTVVDGTPEFIGLSMFVVGLEQPPSDTLPAQGSIPQTRSRITVGAYNVAESYTIPCYIDVRMAGTVQKAPRDAAESLFNTFEALLAADPSLGDLLHGGQGLISDVTATPVNLGSVTESGRGYLISMNVRVTNVTS